ncbi:MAG TPA: hypothetical protein GXZ98_09680 [Firmicutes bacterium]|jgi:hypothetical protein|nr:hypothetical protein [Bacillota bacterium]
MMKKTILILLMALIMISIPASAWGFTTPSISKNHGVFYGLIASDSKIAIGGEFGFTNELAVCAALEDKVKIGLKYELNSSVAILGGMIESSPYIGLNGATALSKDLAGMGELDFTINNSKVNFVYNLGLKYNLPQNIDLRGGLRGNLGEGNQVLFALGIGYKF